MKQLILVRHGESEWNKLNLFTGWTDVDLTDAGRKEAYEAAGIQDYLAAAQEQLDAFMANK